MPFDVAATPAVRSLEPERRLLHLGDLALQFTLDEEPDRSKAATARKAFREAIQMRPGLALAHAGLALALRAGEHADGDAAVERALELAPDDALVCLYAAEYFLPPRGSDAPVDQKRLKRARELIHRGLELAPDLPALHLALGRSFLLDGQDPAQAVAPLERSQELLRWDMEGALALGEAYLRTGARERARVTLTRVVNGTHDDRQRKRANELLGEFGEAATAEGTEE
jgi:tetratricopeptide (TPR) repeat protein